MSNASMEHNSFWNKNILTFPNCRDNARIFLGCNFASYDLWQFVSFMGPSLIVIINYLPQVDIDYHVFSIIGQLQINVCQ